MAPMTPTEKAEAALNRRLEKIQASLREATSEPVRRFLAQSIVVSIGLGEAMTDYVRMIGVYAQGRYGEIKEAQATLTAEHADLLKSGGDLLEQLKANPTDRDLLREIERAQQAMESIQKNLRREANSLQRDLAPSLAMTDKIAETVRRLAEAEQLDAVKRAVGLSIEHVRELYRSHPAVSAKDVIDATSWEKFAGSEIDRAAGFNEAYALAGYQVLRALELMTMAVSSSPPLTIEEASRRANESVSARLKVIAARFAPS